MNNIEIIETTVISSTDITPPELVCSPACDITIEQSNNHCGIKGDKGDPGEGGEFMKLVYADLTQGKLFSRSDLQDKFFLIFKNSISKYLEVDKHYTIRGSGGFVLNEALAEDDFLILLRGVYIATFNQRAIGAVPNLQEVTDVGNITDHTLVIKPAVELDEATTLGQVQDLIAGKFEIVSPVNNNVIVSGPNMKKAVVSSATTVNALPATPGQTGILIIVQDDIGGNVVSLSPLNKGTVVLNTLPRAITELKWMRIDTSAYWETRVLEPGIVPTTLPTINLDDYYDTLEVYHSLPDSEILMSVNNGPWVPYPGKFSIGAVDRPAGYWKFMIKGLEPTRLPSAIASSLPARSIKKGFTYTFNFKLA